MNVTTFISLWWLPELKYCVLFHPVHLQFLATKFGERKRQRPHVLIYWNSNVLSLHNFMLSYKTDACQLMVFTLWVMYWIVAMMGWFWNTKCSVIASSVCIHPLSLLLLYWLLPQLNQYIFICMAYKWLALPFCLQLFLLLYFATAVTM